MTSSTRILVAMDSMTDCRDTVRMAADLAERLQGELEGLFIEDIDLINLAALPFAHEITFSASSRPLDSGAMEQALKVQARQMRDLLVEAAERRRLSWRFRTARGQVLSELSLAATETNFVALGRSLQTRLRQGKASTRTTAAASSTTTLLLSQYADVPLEGPVIVLYDGSRAALCALDMAGRLAGPKRSVSIMAVAESSEEANRLRQQAREHCKAERLNIDDRIQQCRDVEAVVAALRAERQGIVVVPVDGGIFGEEALHVLTGGLHLSVLVVREPIGEGNTPKR
ncbi:MAG TPA: universal stress protein [Candidatus Cybelea sp.]|nr:universal stress protein [Candidatus Cybelea sp.]